MMKRIKCFIDRDKEEQYLNEMAQEGMAFCNLTCFNAYIPIGIYHFEQSNPNEYVYRLAIKSDAIGNHMGGDIENIHYTDIESVTKKKNWEYLRKKGSFELFPEQQEQISFYKKARDVYRTFLVLLVFWLFSRAAVWGETLFNFTLSKFIWLAGFSVAFFAIANASHCCNKKLKNLQHNQIYRS